MPRPLGILSILFLFYRSVMDHSLQIALQKRKQQQWTHLEHQYSTYRKNFQGRPLLPKQVNTFLEFSSIITQLIPTFNHHYFQALTTDQSAFISQITSAIFNDLQAKLKNLAHRIQKKQIEESNYKDVKTLCKVCLHQLREAEIKEAKQSLQGREKLAHNILKIIREVQQTSDTFSRQEDQRFFDDLRAVLKKKEEVIQLCHTQTTEFISMIDEQLRDLLLNKDQLLMREDRSDQPTIKGYQLKENVSKSLKTHLNEKIPQIINMVRASLQKWEDKQKKLRTVSTAVQTIDSQSIRIIELKRKISSLQADLQQSNIERSQLSWSVQEKMLTIQKYQQQHTQMREELSSTTYQLHKQIKSLQQKNKKLRQEIDKQKSKRYLDNSQNNLKSFNSIAQIKQTSLVDEPIDESINMSIRKSKKKVTITSANKTGGKFYLPTLKKINVEDGEVTLLRESSKHYFESQQQSLAEVQPNKAIVKDTYTEEKAAESAKASQSKVQSKKSMKSVSRQGKKIERVMTLDNGKDTIKQGAIPKKKSGKVRTERATQERESLNDSQTLPLVKQNINKVSNFNKKKEVKRLNNSPNKTVERSPQQQYFPKEQQKKIENIVMRQQAKEVSQKLQQKVYDRANSLSSAASNKSTDINSKRIPRSSILKNHKNTTQDNIATLPQKPLKTLKSYLSNSFSKINEEIDKESYMTPLLVQQTASLKELQQLEENKPVKRHLLQIYKEISEKEQTQQLSLQKFNEYFTNYIETVKQKNGLGETDVIKNDCSAVNLHQDQKTQHNVAGHIFASQQNRKEQTLVLQENTKKLDLLKSKLLHQITKHKTQQTSLNTSYRPSLQYTADTARPPKTNNKQSQIPTNMNLLVTLETTLFFNQEIAFQYQTNFTRKKQKVAQLTPCIQQYLKDLFTVFEQLKQEDEEYYHKISGFLRYPYSHSQNGFLQVDILKTLSYSAITQFFLRIIAYHRHCNDKRNETEHQICSHLLNFIKILEDRLKVSKGRQ